VHKELSELEHAMQREDRGGAIVGHREVELRARVQRTATIVGRSWSIALIEFSCAIAQRMPWLPLSFTTFSWSAAATCSNEKRFFPESE
jgi:hypothetical protein